MELTTIPKNRDQLHLTAQTEKVSQCYLTVETQPPFQLLCFFNQDNAMENVQNMYQFQNDFT
jgi:hypothetical protein